MGIGAADDPIQHLLPRTKFLVLWYTCFRKQKKVKSGRKQQYFTKKIKKLNLK